MVSERIGVFYLKRSGKTEDVVPFGIWHSATSPWFRVQFLWVKESSNYISDPQRCIFLMAA